MIQNQTKSVFIGIKRQTDFTFILGQFNFQPFLLSDETGK